MAERPPVLRVNDRVVFAGDTHTVVAISGTALRLLSVAGQTTVVALAYLLGAEDFELIGASPIPKITAQAMVNTLPAPVLAAAQAWQRHLVEVETGLAPDAPGDAVPRPEYDPAATSLAARQQAKAAELSAAGTATSFRTMQRMRRRYREQGLWGLVDARHARLAKPLGVVDARVLAAATAVIEAQTHTSTGTKSRAIRQIRQVLDEEHGPGEVAMPSRASCYRLLEALAAGKYSFSSAVTRRQAANRPPGAHTATTAARPGEQVQLDSTPLDVMAVLDDGVIGRAELVLAVDIATRTICAGLLRPVGAKAVDAALLLARVMVPEPMRPGWDDALAMSASRIPHRRLVSLDTRMAMAAAKPVIVPDTVVIDHGKVFLSEVFTRAADTLGISVQPAHQQSPTDKAVVERTFASINTLFCQHVAGYTGRDTTRRGRDVAERALWSLPDLQELFDEWVIAGWQTRPHDGLRHPFTPDQAASPNDAYAALVAAAGYVPVSLSGEDYIELLPAQWRAISDVGVQIDYRTYSTPELRRYAHLNSGVTARGGRWEVHYDPYDVSRIWVRNHHHGGWITAGWSHQHVVGQPFADFTWRASRRIAAQRGLDDTNEMAVAVILAALLRRAEHGPGAERALARHTSAQQMTAPQTMQTTTPTTPPPQLLPGAPTEASRQPNGAPPSAPIAASRTPGPIPHPEPTPATSPAHTAPPAAAAAGPIERTPVDERDTDRDSGHRTAPEVNCEGEPESPAVVVVPFGLFDPFADDLRAGR